VRTEPAIEVGVDPLQVESLQKGVQVGHRKELARAYGEPSCRTCHARAWSTHPCSAVKLRRGVIDSSIG
jgi:hypothetical protein